MQFAEIAVICASDSFVGNRMTAIVLAESRHCVWIPTTIGVIDGAGEASRVNGGFWMDRNIIRIYPGGTNYLKCIGFRLRNITSVSALIEIKVQ